MNETFDFVVIGSGGGALCAALTARTAGKSVLILEKAALVGGTTATSGGVMWIPNNRFMKEAGVPDSRDDAIAYLDAVIGDDPNLPGASRERRIKYIDEAPRMIEFLIDQGVKLRRIPSWPDYYRAPGESVPGRTVVSELFNLKELGEWQDKLRPGFLPMPVHLDEAMQMPLMKRSKPARKVLFRLIGRILADKLRGRKRTTAGQALQGQLLKAVLAAGVEIRVNSPVKQLLVDDNRVTGVVTEHNGTEQRIGASKGVLINAGGFARNQEMLDRYIPGTSSEWSNVIPEDTGDLILEGQRIGAALAHMEERIGGQVVLPPGNPPMKPIMQNETSKPHCIVVDQRGVRYMNEAGSSVEFARRMRTYHEQNGQTVPSWMIFDSQFMDKYMLAGTMPGLKKKPQEWFDSGFLRKADTLDELASLCNLDAAPLRSSVDRFNDMVRRGKDEDFQRGEHVYEEWLGDPLHDGPNKSLGSVEEGPFYAMQLYPGDVSTFGGLLTDAHARVLREDGSVIEGLYASGTSTASALGGVEVGAGGSIGPAMTFGYIAARHACGLDTK